jgi:hypothetical protein
MRWLPHLLLGTALLAAVGCGKPLAAVIPGIYIAEYEGDQDTLKVLPDGTYTHAVGSRVSGQVNRGKWIVETLPGEQLGLSFDAFRFRKHEGGIGAPGIWHVTVQADAFSNEYRLCFDPDLGNCFVKKNYE